MPRLPHSLTPHPSNSPCDDLAVAVSMAWGADGALVLRYRVHDRARRLRVPPPAAARRADGLWRHTCLEAFVGLPGAAAYREFNFSPSGCWAAYGFADYRVRDAARADLECPGSLLPESDGFVLQASVPRGGLPAAPVLEIGLAAVLEGRDGVLGYWALRHPAGRPDFHWRDGRCLTLAVPSDGEQG